MTGPNVCYFKLLTTRAYAAKTMVLPDGQILRSGISDNTATRVVALTGTNKAC